MPQDKVLRFDPWRASERSVEVNNDKFCKK